MADFGDILKKVTDSSSDKKADEKADAKSGEKSNGIMDMIKNIDTDELTKAAKTAAESDIGKGIIEKMPESVQGAIENFLK